MAMFNSYVSLPEGSFSLQITRLEEQERFLQLGNKKRISSSTISEGIQATVNVGRNRIWQKITTLPN